MRCWIFHKWGKWERYTVKYERQALNLTPIAGDFTRFTGTPGMANISEDRQGRVCQRCGYTQEEKINGSKW